MQALRRRRHPVSGATLADELDISLRTLYRDIVSLQAQGACIAGEAGVGYVLRPGFLLPPLMFSAEEIEALVLGSQWVAERADASLGDAARNVVAKISAVLPEALRHQLETSALLIGPGPAIVEDSAPILHIRRAIRAGTKLAIRYRDPDGHESARTIWPFALGYFDRVRVVVAWCEMRTGFRHFRTDRIADLTVSDERYPRDRKVLLAEWRQNQGVQTSRVSV